MGETATPVKVEVVETRIRDVPAYARIFEAALPGVPLDIDDIVKAIAAYERTMEPGIAPFDRWLAGDEQAISQSAKRGFVLFNREANCFACHSAWRFTDDRFHDIGTTTTDLIPLASGLVMARGKSDTERLQTGELVYAGVRRTPVCALATCGSFVPFPAHAATAASASVTASIPNGFFMPRSRAIRGFPGRHGKS